jgi:quinol monooxygenase YgiN
MIVRIFDTAMDPDVIEDAKRIFKDEVQPAFGAFDGCHGVEMHIGVEAHRGELVEIAAISRWDSMEAIEDALASREYEVALVNLRELFAQAPIVRHFQTAE